MHHITIHQSTKEIKRTDSSDSIQYNSIPPPKNTKKTTTPGPRCDCQDHSHQTNALSAADKEGMEVGLIHRQIR